MQKTLSCFESSCSAQQVFLQIIEWPVLCCSLMCPGRGLVSAYFTWKCFLLLSGAHWYSALLPATETGGLNFLGQEDLPEWSITPPTIFFQSLRAHTSGLVGGRASASIPCLGKDSLAFGKTHSTVFRPRSVGGAGHDRSTWLGKVGNAGLYPPWQRGRNPDDPPLSPAPRSPGSVTLPAVQGESAFDFGSEISRD